MSVASKASSYYSVADAGKPQPPSPYQKKTIKLLNHLSKEDNINDIAKRINSFHHVKQLLEEGFDTDISQAVDFSRQLLERGMVQVRVNYVESPFFVIQSTMTITVSRSVSVRFYMG